MAFIQKVNSKKLDSRVLRNLFPKSDNPIQEYPQQASLTLSSVVKTKFDQDKAKKAFEDKYMR